jgi:hypothetical protein
MKTTTNTHLTTFFDKETEKMMNQKTNHLSEDAKRDAIRFAESNRPLPSGDNILNYIGRIKAGYEELIANILQNLLTGVHFHEGQTDTQKTQAKTNQIKKEMTECCNKVKNLELNLDSIKTNASNIGIQILRTFLIGLIICIGELVFNTMAFQVMGDIKLFSFFLSLGITTFTAVVAHYGARKLKTENNPRKKIIINIILAVCTIPVFIALAYLRKEFLHSLNSKETIPAIVFVIFNCSLFIATVMLFLRLPTKEEIEAYKQRRVICKNIEKYEHRKKVLQNEAIILEDELTKINKQRLRIAYYTEYTIERIKKIYLECVTLFISYNLKYRNDNQTPDCFSDIIPELEINNTIFFNKSNFKEDKQ